jgi:hypothetical protein
MPGKLNQRANRGMVFVGEWDGVSDFGNVIWCDVFNNNHRGGGFNHPGDLRLFEYGNDVSSFLSCVTPAMLK